MLNSGEMKERPLSVSIIGWFLIVGAVLNLAMAAFSMFIPIPGWRGGGWAWFGLNFLWLCFGVGILKGSNLSRLLYVVVRVFMLWMSLDVYMAFGFPTKMPLILSQICSMIFAVFSLLFLFLPKANAFFRGKAGRNVVHGAADDVSGAV